MTSVLYRGAALADGLTPELRLGVSILVSGGKITWIRDNDEPDPGDAAVVDAGGTTIVPGMVDGHSHLTLPGGSHWIDRGSDEPSVLVEVAEHNAILQNRSGVRWARDVGSPRGIDPFDKQERALALGVRDRWRGRTDRPYVRAAGTWIAREEYLPAGLAIDVADGDGLLAAAEQQLDEGADFLKVMLDGPDPDMAPFTVGEVSKVVAAAHATGATVTAHSTNLPGARVAADAAVDSIEHGMHLDAGVARLMATNGVTLVATLTVLRSWLSFGTTTTISRFTEPDNVSKIHERLETANESVRLAHAAGVAIAAGTDFGGGSSRANQLAWEVESLVEAGLEPWQALGAVTWRGGELLGEESAGRVTEGGPADFFCVHGDPLSEPAALWRVWKVAWID